MQHRIYQLAIDYQHIRVYGLLHNWTMELIKGKQFIAHLMNAPFDTVDIIADVPVRFTDLSYAERNLFNARVV